MSISYFNHFPHLAQSWWDRRSFALHWQHIYASDPYWVSPYYPTLRQALEPGRNPHLARQNPLIIYLEALPQRRQGVSVALGAAGPLIEEPVVAAVALCDPRRQDGTAYLALLHCVNHADSLNRLLDYLARPLRRAGYRRLIGPTGLSPHLGSGVLQDHWDRLPPLHSPANPPYLPDLMSEVMRVRSRSQLYHLPVPAHPAPPEGPATLHPLNPARLAADLLPLLAAACPPWLDFAPPDAQEAAFLLHWLNPWPTFGWVAHLNDEAVGFVLLQPDLAPYLHRARGGRRPLWRLWLRAWAARRPAAHGRLLFGGVGKSWRGQGIGRQLVQQALYFGRRQGWKSLRIGPLPVTAPGAQFLEHLGATARQSYLLYRQEL